MEDPDVAHTVSRAESNGSHLEPVSPVVIRPNWGFHALYLAVVAISAVESVQQLLAGDYVEPIGLVRLLIPLLLYAGLSAQRVVLDDAGVHRRYLLGHQHHTWDDVVEVVMPSGMTWWRRAYVRVDTWPAKVDIAGVLAGSSGDAQHLARQMATRHGVPLRTATDTSKSILIGLLVGLITVLTLIWGAVTVLG
jgi:hypothetical protein